MIRYTVIPTAPHAHRLTIRCQIDQPDMAGQALRFATWIPGSYLIREFSRHIVGAYAEHRGRPIKIWKTNKQTWQTAPLKTQETLTVNFEIHAWDQSVRGAHFDQYHLFFNGCAVFPEVLGQHNIPCQVAISQTQSDNGKRWSVFTGLTMQTVSDLPNKEQPNEHLGVYIANSYSELIDHPFELGEPTQYQVLHFGINGIKHSIVLRNAGNFNATRLQHDLQLICAHIIALFGTAPPFSEYLFLTTLTGNGYGGLEHRNSTALIANRDDLPALGLPDSEPANEQYTRFLGLCAHEYFHAWHVKSLQDRVLVTSDLSQEAYTTLLWFFEGFTSYYDDLSLVRSGVISTTSYVQCLEKTLKQVNTPAEHRQSVAESSFDAWIKYYRPDENGPNSVVSYYAKGSLIALALDLTLRREGLSLDSWMRLLWQDFALNDLPLDETMLLAHLSEFAGKTITDALAHWIHTHETLNLSPLLNDVGLVLNQTPSTGLAAWGLSVNSENTLARIAHVRNDSPAETAGLAPGDLLVAINQQRVTHANLEKTLDRLKHCPKVQWLIFREDLLQELHLKNNKICHQAPQLSCLCEINQDQTKQQQAWLWK